MAAGQSSTITGTLSGQIVMEGFLNLRMRPWMRRLVTRGLALIPATIVIALSGDHGLYRITLLHVVDTPGTLMLKKESWGLHGAEDESYLAHLTREIEDTDLPVEFLLLHGHPADAIIDYVKTAGIDMLLMESHEHRGVVDLVFGQTVSAVRHALDIPVLVVRSRGRERAQRG